MKKVAKAPANIAFIKYWGKKDEKLRLPMNASISMNLSEVYTQTSVEFLEKLKEDFVEIDGIVVAGKEKERVSEHLDRVRKLAEINLRAVVKSKNNFPKGTGLASSASGFAALTVAASSALGLNLSEKELSILARLGSGSACRSVPSGFVEWKEGGSSEESYAYSLYPPDYWEIEDVIAIVGEESKKVSSTEGHSVAESSPFYETRIKGMKDKVREIKKAMEVKDFTKFGEILEEEAVNMHSVMMTSKPPLFYWTPETMEIMLAVQGLRDSGLEAYFTIDAGPNVHIICNKKDAGKIKSKLSKINGIKVISNHPSIGAILI
ncbi:MAG: diphosphomevalonate decarboxylase [Patescibacteria group bacterium]